MSVYNNIEMCVNIVIWKKDTMNIKTRNRKYVMTAYNNIEKCVYNVTKKKDIMILNVEGIKDAKSV